MTLIRNVFSTPDAKELMEHWDDLYVNCRLYAHSDRDTAYAVAQRDLILEIKDHLKTSAGEQIPGGTEIGEEDAIN